MKTLLADVVHAFTTIDNAICNSVLEEFKRGEPSEQAKEGAARLLVAIGLTKLLGIHISEDKERIPTATAMGAIDVLLRWTAVLKRQVDELPRRCAEAGDEEEANTFCADVLTGRMRLWAAEIALNAVTVNAIDHVDPLLDKFSEKADAFSLALFGLDKKMGSKTIMRLLARLSPMSMLRDWRSVLASPYCYFLPYWLDGTLERLKEGET